MTRLEIRKNARAYLNVLPVSSRDVSQTGNNCFEDGNDDLVGFFLELLVGFLYELGCNLLLGSNLKL